ncbi:MAG: LysR family transcriptional regulator [Pseudomonadota bacterium]
MDKSGRFTLWGIEVFAATAEELSISAAARRLGASPSAVSQQITNLEAGLGVALFDRSVRPMTLTSAGALFRRRAQTILNEAEAARAELATRDLSRLASLSLGMIEDFDANVSPRLLAEMGGLLDGTRFLLETGPSHRLYDLLEAKALDIVVAAESVNATGMEVHPLMEEPFVAVAPKGLVKGDAREVLSATPFIRYTSRHLMGRQIADHLATEGLTVRSRYELDSYHAILAMISEGAGWAILTPLGVLRAERFLGQVDVLPLPVAPISRRISLVAREEALWGMPKDLAARLRPLIEDLIVGPARAQLPFLGDSLRVL